MKSIKKRRRENKTDYQKRMGILKGNLPRIVFRKTNRYIISEYAVSDETRDRIELGITSKILLKYGWPEKFRGSLKSIPASYLTGLLIGKKIIRERKETPIVDFGMIRNIHKSKAFAFLNGLVDAGVKIKHDKKTFPEEDRIKGKNLKEDFSKTFEAIKLKIEKE